MQKIKFKISGINSQSDTTKIENELKKHSGVIMSKVNYESKKAVVVFDENKAEESDFTKIINKLGSYEVEKVDEPKNTPVLPEEEIESLKIPEIQSSSIFNSATLLGIFVGISIMSIALNIILIIILI